MESQKSQVFTTGQERGPGKGYVGVLFIALCLGSFSYLLATDGFTVWLALGSVCIFSMLSLRFLASVIFPAKVPKLTNAMLVAGSVCFCLAIAESGLYLYEKYGVEIDPRMVDAGGPLLLPNALTTYARTKILSRNGVVVLPEEWQHKKIEGRQRDFMWQGALHQVDANGFRRDGPFPDKRSDVFRIVVFGDSLTYGAGVALEHSYSAVMQDLLSAHHSVEVLNLGVSGYQSADILTKVEQFVPRLEPDLVVYGVCLNDFLPSRADQYAADDYAFPLPVAVKKFLVDRSRVGSFVADRYDQILLQYGIRIDFMDDILSDFEGYQQRFQQDVSAISEHVQGVNDIPLLAMVLHQRPVLESRAHKMTLIAESILREANFDVVPTQGYFAAYDGFWFRVNQWEGHPNEFANALFASMLVEHIKKSGDLEHYQHRTTVAVNP